MKKSALGNTAELFEIVPRKDTKISPMGVVPEWSPSGNQLL